MAQSAICLLFPVGRTSYWLYVHGKERVLGFARLQVKFPDGKIVTSMYARQPFRKYVGTIARCGYRLGVEGRGRRVDGSRGLVNILICSFGVTLLILKGSSFLKQVFL